MEANLLGAPAIAPKHVLLALVHERAGLARRLLSDLSIQQARELVAPGVTIQMKAKAASDLVLARYDPVVHPEFAGMLAELPHLRGAADHAVIFTNASSEPLTSIVARWTVVDPTTRGPERKPGYVGWLESARHMPKPPELYRDGELRSS
jgi:hypothetical protein